MVSKYVETIILMYILIRENAAPCLYEKAVGRNVSHPLWIHT